MKKILYFASAVLALVAVSCNKFEISDAGHQAGEPDVAGCYKVSFPEQEASGDHTYDPTMDPKVEITVVRANAKGAITVPYKISASEDGIFSGSEIKFENGQDTTTLVVSFPDSKTDGTKYSFSIKIDDPQYASHYADAVTDFDFSVMRVEYKKFADGTISIYGPIYSSGPKTAKRELWYYEVAGIRYCKIVDGILAANTTFTADYTFTWNVKTNRLYVPYQKTSYVEDGVDCYIGDAKAYYGLKYGEDYWAGSTSYTDWYDYCEKQGLLFAEYDGNGGFYLADWYLCDYAAMPGYGWQFGGDSTKDCDSFICDGFTRTDFTIGGIATDYSVKGLLPVRVTTGRDAKTIRYACADGELTATQAAKLAQAIQDKTAQDVKTSSEYVYVEDKDVNVFDFNLKFAKSGVYSVVVVVNSTDSTYVSDFASFQYVAEGDVEEHKVNLTCATEDISLRWGYDKTEAFQYYVLGKDIQKLHMVVVVTDKYLANKDAYESTIKTNALYAVDEEVIDLVNGEGGFASYVYGLTANTSYTLLIWAANSDQDGIFTAEYKTDGLPRQLVGTGVYTFCGKAFSGSQKCELYIDPNIKDAKNPYNLTFVIPNWAAGGEFFFTVDAQTNDIHVQPSYTGADYQAGYPVNAYEGSDVYTKCTTKSSVDQVNQIFNFVVAYYVPGLGGFGYGDETLAMDKAAASSAVASVNASANFKSLSTDYPVRTLPEVRNPKISFKPIEREVSTVKFESSKAPYTPKEKPGMHKASVELVK